MLASNRGPGGNSRLVGSRLVAKIAFSLTLLLAVGCSDSEPPPPPPLEIPVVEVIQRDQPIGMEMVGETQGSSDIPVRARVEGVLLGMHFTEGRTVDKGQLLYEIDPVPYESKVVEAEGGLAEARTNLAQAEADLNRIRPLAEINAVSKADLDGAVAKYDAALGSLKSARARVEQAEIQLSYTKIESPITGRIGISEARVGEFVGRSPNPVVLNFVSQVDPIRAKFSIDERRYMLIARRLSELDTKPGESAEMSRGLELILADGTLHPHRGRVVGADAAVDPKTGTFTLEADFPNPNRLVLAGQFARVRAVVETRANALLVPSRSVSELQGSFRVFVVDGEGKVELRPIELGPTIGKLQIVETGLKPGERVAVEVMRLRPGMQITPKLVELGESGAVPADAEATKKAANQNSAENDSTDKAENESKDPEAAPKAGA